VRNKNTVRATATARVKSEGQRAKGRGLREGVYKKKTQNSCQRPTAQFSMQSLNPSLASFPSLFFRCSSLVGRPSFTSGAFFPCTISWWTRSWMPRVGVRVAERLGRRSRSEAACARGSVRALPICELLLPLLKDCDE